MRIFMILFGVLAVVGFFGISVYQSTGSRNEAQALQVNDVGADPAAYVGEIVILGIMAGISKNDSAVFGVMDKKELQCAVADCGKVIIPVKFGGATPTMGDEVLVTGSFQRSKAGLLFMASEVEIIRNHSLGG